MNTIVELVRHDKSLKLRHCSLEIFRERMQVFSKQFKPKIKEYKHLLKAKGIVPNILN